MANQSAQLDRVFQALADPTRRAILERLNDGPTAVTELASPFKMALPSFLQHLKVLEGSGLVHSEKVGRVRTFQASAGSLETAGHWLAGQRAMWELRLDQFDTYVRQLKEENDD